MVSRRAILSRSRDDLASGAQADMFSSHAEDQWFSKEKLYKDHIIEVLAKWDSIDDEIWAKVIVLERNRRIAKAYARAPVLTVNGSEEGFDGFRIGVNGFENPLRDNKTQEFKEQIGKGCKLKMDDSGNILVKRLSRSNIYVKNTMEENAVSNDILKLPNGVLEFEKPFKLFDMKKFQQNVNRELKRQYPERLKLETQCISTIALVKNEQEVLDCPIWIMLINVVALEMLKAKLPTSMGQQKGLLPNFHHHRVSSDEDPYSLSPAESSQSGSSGKGLRQSRRDESGDRLTRPEKELYGPRHWAGPGRGELSDVSEEYVTSVAPLAAKEYTRGRRHRGEGAARYQEDPYYHGLSARVPSFPASKQEKESINYSKARLKSPVRGVTGPGLPGPGPAPAWWHTRLYQTDSGSASSDQKEPKSKPSRNRVASPTRAGFFRTSWK